MSASPRAGENFDAGAELERVSQAAKRVRERLGTLPAFAIVLGSGLAGFAERLTNPVAVGYGELPGFCTPTVPGHSGQLCVGAIGRRSLAVLSGRVHCYEGYTLHQVVFPIRVLARCGVTMIVLTNAAGAIHPNIAAGSLALIRDHINLIGNPLVGCGEVFGTPFPDMTEVYDAELRAQAQAAGKRCGIRLEAGVYVAVSGPSYETPAEIRALRALGADLVGMSTAPEAVVARQAQMRVLGISLVSNAAAGVSPGPITHEEVLAAGRAAGGKLFNLLSDFVEHLDQPKRAARRTRRPMKRAR